MLTLKSRSESDGLQEAINDVLSELKGLTTETEEYAKAIAHLSTLYKLKESNSKPISRDTMLIVAGNLAGIVLILGFEKANVVTSKALSFVMKLR